MDNIHSFKYLKYLLIILILYNIISLLVLFLPFKSLKYNLWNMMPYDYKNLVNYPNDLKNLSLLNSTNRDFIKEVLKGIDFNKYNFEYFLIETKNLEIINFLKNKNYSFIKKLSHHDYLFKFNKNQ